MEVNNVYNRVKYIIGKIAVYALLVLYPFVMTDKLNNVTLTRYTFFIVLTCILFAGMIINWMIHIIVSKSNIIVALSELLKNKCVICALVFAIVSVVSYLVSPYKEFALYGKSSRYIGLLAMLALSAIYIVVSLCYRFNRIDIDIIIVSSIIVNIMALLNYVDIDILHLLSNLTDDTKNVYMSTLGNINVYGMYTVSVTTIAAWAYTMYDGNHNKNNKENNKENNNKNHNKNYNRSGKDINIKENSEKQEKYNKKHNSENARKILYYAGAVFGMMGAVVCNSDMVVVGLAGMFVIIMYCSIGSLERFSRGYLLLLSILISGQIIGIVHAYIPDRTRNLDGIMSVITILNSKAMICVIVGCAIYMVLVLWDRAIEDKLKNYISKIRYTYVVIIVIALVYIAVQFIKDNIKHTGIFYITDDWGSGRGYIWKNIINGYSNYPMINKIFGLGEGTIGINLNRYADVHWNLINGGMIDNAHNIWLHMLATMGIAGVIALLLLVIKTVHSVVNILKSCGISSKTADTALETAANKSYNEEIIILAGAGIAAILYALQGSGNLLEIITFPMFVCMMAMMNGKQD